MEPLGTLGAPWKTSAPGVAVKPYPSCARTHSIIDGALELHRAHRIRAADADGRPRWGVTPGVPRILIHSNPQTGLEGSFSLAEYAWRGGRPRRRDGPVGTPLTLPLRPGGARSGRVGRPSLSRVRAAVDPTTR